jgi:glucose/arabinose dehydrogenase
MTTPRTLAGLLLVLAACSGSNPSDGQPPPGTASIRLERIAQGLGTVVHLASPPGDARLFVVEQQGHVRVIENGAVLPTPFLSIPERISAGGERGLLSVAFHPHYAQNGFFYVNYTDTRGDTRVERYHVSADRNRADPGSATTILQVVQPYSNHNGGLVAFGPDGKLYVGMGDGGGGGDPDGNGQDPLQLLGKMLRLDVDAGTPYGIPADNPYVGQAGRRPEIWAMGMRNPWRFSWDRAANLLYVADVGQNRLEEVDVAPAGQGGLNYGWNTMEGDDCYEPSSGCNRNGLLLPAVTYTHDDGCSVTGGFVYRGQDIPALRGHYLYADYCEGWIRSFRYENGRATDARTWDTLQNVGNISSFGEDARGELYVLAHDGSVYKIVAAQ